MMDRMHRMTGHYGLAISLFSGVGGLDLGAVWAGYTVAAALERDRDAATTMMKNFHGLQDGLY
jgi:DNA (cytosine-5)-methyltransferase 1